ncbi:MAG: hypothetical protein ACOC1K_01125 [Nanoarchaeota archaeon]
MKKIKEKFLKWLSIDINEQIQDYTAIDGFIIDNKLSEEEIKELQNMKLKVIEVGDKK